MADGVFVPYLSVTNAVDAVDFYSRVLETEPTNLLNMLDGRVMPSAAKLFDEAAE
jgi:uncharacterized glyoxalase superfamily protein PhnB